MIRVYGAVTSINVRKVLWTCELLAIPYKACDVTTPKYQRILQLNPNKMMPVLVDNGSGEDFVMWESNSIIRYLAEQYSVIPEFYPENPQKRARVNQWLNWQATDFNASWSIAFQKYFRGNHSFTEQQVEASVKNWEKHIAILE